MGDEIAAGSEGVCFRRDTVIGGHLCLSLILSHPDVQHIRSKAKHVRTQLFTEGMGSGLPSKVP